MNWVIGKSGFEPQAGSNPVQPGKLVDDPTRLLSVINQGWAAALWLSNW
jgi:hypothetical protein